MRAHHIQTTYRMPVYGWGAHPTRPIYNFEVDLYTDVFFGRNTPGLLISRTPFTGTVDEARETARMLRELYLIKEGVTDGNE